MNLWLRRLLVIAIWMIMIIAAIENWATIIKYDFLSLLLAFNTMALFIGLFFVEEHERAIKKEIEK